MSTYVPHHRGVPLISDTGRRIRDEVAALVPLMRKHALEGEHIGALPQETLQALDATGAFVLTTPVELGGHALGIRDVVDIVAEMGRGDGAAGWMGFVAGGVRNLLGFPEQAVQEVFEGSRDWTGPLAAGASVFATRVGDARRADGGWYVKGTWHFGSGCKHAAWVGVGVEYAGEAGPRRGMVLLKQDQVEILDDWHVMGMRGTCSNSVRAQEEVFVPAHRFIDMGEMMGRMDALRGRYEGLAYKIDGAGLMLVTLLTNMAVTLGMARGALECFVEQTQRLKPFSLPYDTVADMASTQMVAAKAAAMLAAAEAMIHRHAEWVDCAAIDGTALSPEQASAVSMNSVYGASLCDQAVGMLQLCLGSSTARESNPIQRFVRDIRVANLHGAVRLDPTAEIHGRVLLGRQPFDMFAGALPNVGGPPPAGAPAR